MVCAKPSSGTWRTRSHAPEQPGIATGRTRNEASRDPTRARGIAHRRSASGGGAPWVPAAGRRRANEASIPRILLELGVPVHLSLWDRQEVGSVVPDALVHLDDLILVPVAVHLT